VPAMSGVFVYKAAALVQAYRDNDDLTLVLPMAGKYQVTKFSIQVLSNMLPCPGDESTCFMNVIFI